MRARLKSVLLKYGIICKANEEIVWLAVRLVVDGLNGWASERGSARVVRGA
jgi:hypothetical protein